MALTAACASAPPFDPGMPVAAAPPAWTAGASTAAGADSLLEPWWSDLDDPNLGALIAEGLAHNHDLAASAARVERAVAQARMSGAGRWPRASADGESRRSRRNFLGFPDFGGAVELPAVTTNTFDAAFTASFSGGPASHNGRSRFNVTLTFSEEFSVSYRTLQNRSLQVDGGRIVRVSRRVRNSNLRWRVRIRPSGRNAVTIALPGDRPCDARGALCTRDGRRLTGTATHTVPGR